MAEESDMQQLQLQRQDDIGGIENVEQQEEDEDEQAAVGNHFGLPPEVLSVLPHDPFEQLDVARKITSIALSFRLSRLEQEAARLRRRLAEKDDVVADLHAQLGSFADKDDVVADLRRQVDSLAASLSSVSGQLALAQEEKETLFNENAALSKTIKKLNREVSRLEIFKKTLVQSLQEEEDTEHARASRVAPKLGIAYNSFSSGSFNEDEEAALSLAKPYAQNQVLETSSSVPSNAGHAETEIPKPIRMTTLLASQGSTPRLTPPDSPTRRSATGTPNRSSKPTSPRRHSIAFTNARNMFDGGASIYSSLPSGHRMSMSSSFDAANQAGRTRVDGKEFFRQVRSRLSYEQFSAFLANVKELNAQKQTREVTLQKANEIFGPDNKDLYIIFEGLINRNLH